MAFEKSLMFQNIHFLDNSRIFFLLFLFCFLMQYRESWRLGIVLIKLCEEIHLRDLRGICCDGYTQLIIPFFSEALLA